MHVIAGLWRWRGNPLCRRSDRREAWLALCAVLLTLAVAPIAGWLGASTAHVELLESAKEQQRGRHLVWATAESVQTRTPANPDPESTAQTPERNYVVAYWATPDGSSHKGSVRTRHGVQPGERFRIWVDEKGRAAKRPMSARTASSYAALAGLAAGAGAVGAMEAGRRLSVRQLLRRRYARWDEEWARIGPDWGRTGTNS